MRIETIREFVVFAKHLNFSHAARELNLSQPAMSTHIAALEKELGFTLVKRGANIALTPEGGRFLEGAQRLVGVYDETVSDCRHLSRRHPAVRIRTTGSIPFLPDLLETARAQEIPFELVEIPQDAYAPLEELSKDLVDITTIYDFAGNGRLEDYAREHGIETRPVGDQRMTLCLSSSNPLARRTSLSRQDLVGATVTILSSTWYDAMAFFAETALGSDLGLRFRMVPVSGSLAQRYVDLGDSVCIAGVNNDDLLAREDIVRFEELDGEPVVNRVMVAFCGDSPNPNVRKFVEKAVASTKADMPVPGRYATGRP